MADGRSGELVSNRKATFNYEILDTFEAGIVLQGTEIKSLRDHGGSLQEAYIRVDNSELWLIGCSISPYRFGNVHNHEDRRQRKLLMHKREIEQMREATQEKGLTIIPLAFFLKEGRVKVRLAVAKGKKSYDKREAIKERTEKRHMDAMMKKFNS